MDELVSVQSFESATSTNSITPAGATVIICDAGSICKQNFSKKAPAHCAGAFHNVRSHVALIDDVEHAARREAQRWNDGQRHERERHKWIDPARNAQLEGLLLGIFQRLVDFDERRFTHDASDLELHLAEHLAAAGEPVDRRPDGEQRIHRRDGGVVVGSEGDAAFQGAPQRIDPGCAGFPEEDVPMAVAPVIDMGGEERRRVARRSEAIELFLADRLGMDQDVAAIFAGMFGLRGFKRIKGVVGGGIAVGMDEELPTPMRGFDQREQILAAG